MSAWPLGRARGGGARAGDYRGQWGGVSGGSVLSRSSCPVQIRKLPGEEEGGGGESTTSGARGRQGGAQAAGVSAQGVGGAESPGRLRSREVSHRWPGANGARSRPSPPDQLRGADCELEQNSFLPASLPSSLRPPAPPSQPSAFGRCHSRQDLSPVCGGEKGRGKSPAQPNCGQKEKKRNSF